MAAAPAPRLLLVRTSALGDIVHCLPVLVELRRRLPEARIAWAVEGSMASLLRGHPDLDLLVPVRLRTWRRTPFARDTRQEIATALGALRDFAPHLALDLMGNHKGALLARLSGASHVLGAARGHRREPSSALWIDEGVEWDEAREEPLHAVEERLALVARATELARQLPGLPGLPSGLETSAKNDPANDAANHPENDPANDSFAGFNVDFSVDFGADRLLPDALALDDGGRPYAFLHPGAGWGNKVYPVERWGEIARRLAAESGLETRVSVAPGEEDLARRVVAASSGAAREQPAAGLPALVSLLRGARLALGGDTGPLHLAHALGVPSVLVHGPTDPRRHGPYGAVHRAVAKRLPCSFCYRRFAEAKACLWAVPVERVVERAREVLAETSHPLRGGVGAEPESLAAMIVSE